MMREIKSQELRKLLAASRFDTTMFMVHIRAHRAD
jgi:hypothetical protein